VFSQAKIRWFIGYRQETEREIKILYGLHLVILQPIKILRQGKWCFLPSSVTTRHLNVTLGSVTEVPV
jgi:hypothetical protein